MTGETLQKKRLQIGLTQAQLAKLSGFNQMYISQMERGSKPIPEKTAKLLGEILEKASGMDAITIHNIDAKGYSAVAVGRGAIAKSGSATKSVLGEVPTWAKKLQESIDTTNALLLKILERIG